MFKRAMLSPVLGILPQETTLQIETGPQRDPKQSWMEDTHRSFYTHRGFYAEKSLHKGAFYIQKVLHREVFTIRRFCTQTSRNFYTQSFYTKKSLRFLQTDAFAHRSFYTEKPLHRGAFTHKSIYTQQAFTHTGAFAQRSLYAEELFTHRRFYTEKSLL